MTETKIPKTIPIFAQKKSTYISGDKQYIHLTIKYDKTGLQELLVKLNGYTVSTSKRSLTRYPPITVILPATKFLDEIVHPKYFYQGTQFHDWEIVDSESIKLIFSIDPINILIPELNLFASQEELIEFDPEGKHTNSIFYKYKKLAHQEGISLVGYNKNCVYFYPQGEAFSNLNESYAKPVIFNWVERTVGDESVFGLNDIEIMDKVKNRLERLVFLMQLDKNL